MLPLFILACSQSIYETPERLLDPPEVAYAGAGSGDSTLSVTSSADVWTISDADATWTLASPGRPDLGSFDGVDGSVVVDVIEDEGAETAAGTDVRYRSLTIGADSAVHYALSLIEPSTGYAGAFGAEFVQYGDELGTRKVEYWLLTIREVVFATDEGDVALGPAEPTVLIVGGERYLTTVLSAWESEVADESVGQPRCGGVGDRLAYEMVWLPEDVEPEVPQGLEGSGEITSTASCG